MLKADGFDKAIVGVLVSGKQPVVVYDYDKCVKIVMTWQGIEDDLEARDYVEFNVIGGNFGDKTPIFIRKHKTVAEIEDWDYEEDID